MAKKADPGGKIAAQNRRARYDYAISETVEAGLVLTGSEVKSLRAGKGNINEAYAGARDGEIYLLNAHISEYNQARGGGHEPLRPRKLLLKKREVAKLLGAVQREGMTLVPLKIYFNERGIAKAELGLGRGRKAHDRRERIKERDWQRQKSRLMRASVAALALFGLAHAARADEVELKFATVSPPTAASVREFYVPWAARVNEQGKGVLKIDLRAGNALATSNTAYSRVVNDVVQIVYTLFTYVSGKFPHADVAALPLSDSAEVSSVALWRLYKSGMLDSEFDETHPLMFISLPQSVLHLAKAPKTLDTLSGLKIIAPGKITASSTAKLGATPLTLTTAEIYEAIQRGVADGAVVTWNAYQIYKLGEVTRFHVDHALGSAAGMVFMARKRYDALPEGARKVIDANSGEAATRAYGRFWEQDDNKGRKLAQADSRRTLAALTPAQQANWDNQVKAALDEWVQQTPGGDNVLARYRELIAEVKAGR